MSYVIPNETPGHPLSASTTGKGEKAIPASLPSSSFFSSATAPSPRVVTKNPNHVLVHKAGSYYFSYHCNDALGTTTNFTSSVYMDLAVTLEDDTSQRLDISPCAWSGSVGAAGDVTFVYKGR